MTDYVKPIASPVPGYEWQSVYDDSDPPVYLGTFIVPTQEARAEAVRIECCPTCQGVLEHVLGCPEQDKAR